MQEEKNIANIKSIEVIKEDDDFDYKTAYLYVCGELNDAIDRLTRALTIAESICIRNGISREDIMPDKSN